MAAAPPECQARWPGYAHLGRGLLLRVLLSRWPISGQDPLATADTCTLFSLCKSLRSCQAAAIIAGAPWTSVYALGQRENTPYAVLSLLQCRRRCQDKAEKGREKKKGRCCGILGTSGLRTICPSILCPSVGRWDVGERKYWTPTVKGQKKKGRGRHRLVAEAIHGEAAVVCFFFTKAGSICFFSCQNLRYSNYTEGEMIDCRLFEFSLLGGRHSG